MEHRKLLNIELGRMSAEEYKKRPESGLCFVLDNIRSSHNVGSVFRSADSFGVDRIVLCGITSVPPSPEIHKSALGAEFSVAWKYAKDPLQAVLGLKEHGYTVLCIEQAVDSVSLEKFIPRLDAKYAIVLGNEVDGVSQKVVDASDIVIEIPQCGTKHSLNVSVAAGVVLWHIASLRGAFGK